MPRPSGHTGYRNANLCLADDAEQMIDSSRHPELRRNGCVVELGGHHLIEHLTTYRYACALGRVRERERERGRGRNIHTYIQSYLSIYLSIYLYVCPGNGHLSEHLQTCRDFFDQGLLLENLGR